MTLQRKGFVMNFKNISRDKSVFMYVKSIKSFEKRLWFDWCFRRTRLSIAFSKEKSSCFRRSWIMILKTACPEKNICFFDKRSFTHLWTSNKFNRCGDCFIGWPFCCNWYMSFSWSMMWRNYWWYSKQVPCQTQAFFLFLLGNQD